MLWSTESCLLPFSQLVSLFIESFLNGALLFIYAAAAWILLVRNRRNVGKLRRVMFAVATFMLLVSLGVSPP